VIAGDVDPVKLPSPE
jgi:hypothetical protein